MSQPRLPRPRPIFPTRFGPLPGKSSPIPGLRKPVPVASFALKANARDVHGIYFSAGADKVVVVYGEEVKGQPKRKLKIDLHDAAGNFVKTLDLASTLVHGQGSEQCAALNDAGTRIVIRNTEKHNVLEQWDLTEGKKISEATPHGGGEVTDLFLLAGKRVLSNVRGQIALWNLDDGKTIYSLSGYKGILQISPGAHYFVVCNGNTVDLLDVSTGKRKGQLIVPGHGNLSQLDAAAFSDDGKELAAVVATPAGKRLARWSLAKGDFVDAMPTTNDQRPLRWLDGRFLAHDHPLLRQTQLIDWKLKGPVMTYMLWSGQALTEPPDERFWYFYESKGTSYVAGVHLPDGQAQALVDQVAAGQVQPAIPPGSTVSVDIDTNNPQFRDMLNQAVNELAASRGYRVGPGGFVVKLRSQGQQTGKSQSLRIHRMGFGSGPGLQNITIQDYRVDSTIQIFDAQGAVIHTQKNTNGMPFFITFKTQDYQREVEENVWNSAKAWAQQAVVPSTLYRVAGQLQTLPRMVSLRDP